MNEVPLGLGECGIQREKGGWPLTLDALAYTRPAYYGAEPIVFLFSGVGPSTSVKGVTAILRGDNKGAFWAKLPGETEKTYYTRHSSKWNVFRARLAFDHWHILAVANEPKLMTSFSQRALWLEFSSQRFSTPVLRSWTPWIGKRLLEKNLLKRLECFRCEAAVLVAGTKELDDVVKEGIRNKQLAFE